MRCNSPTIGPADAKSEGAKTETGLLPLLGEFGEFWE